MVFLQLMKLLHTNQPNKHDFVLFFFNFHNGDIKAQKEEIEQFKNGRESERER